MKDHQNLRAALDPLQGAPHLPQAVRALIADAHDAVDFEAALYRAAAALVALEDAVARIEGDAKTLRAALLTAMSETGAPNISLPYHTVGTQERRSLRVTDESAIPAHLWTTPKPQPDTTAIRKALQAGAVPGAVLSNGGATLFIRARNK
ncbi:Siphovirus Gp157 [uncultured Caudovirales phage]|uniref:Siphovirus Gp157 n=1 Tax=uncultured Caudovirales phage TaxID=2100421 RepID=A0A6J7XCM1_9CAUD|nr:Siphovirus Gp157 [uncultured Caudovirales phage]CAB5225543.1 Siphovirus Gp157 [uncultured Caudovirales phage]